MAFFMGPWNRAETPRPGLPHGVQRCPDKVSICHEKKLTHRTVGQLFGWAAHNVGYLESTDFLGR